MTDGEGESRFSFKDWLLCESLWLVPGGYLLASSMKVDATSNSPSRKRCIAIARFVKAG